MKTVPFNRSSNLPVFPYPNNLPVDKSEIAGIYRTLDRLRFTVSSKYWEVAFKRLEAQISPTARIYKTENSWVWKYEIGQSSAFFIWAYYRHARNRERKCNPGVWIPADALEEAVLMNLFNLFGDVAAMTKAIIKANPDIKQVGQLENEKANFEKKLKQIKMKRDNIVTAIGRGTLSDEDAKVVLMGVKSQLLAIESHLEVVQARLNSFPTDNTIRHHVKMANKVREDIYRSYPAYELMPYERRQELVKHAFSGKDRMGNRWGVYVRRLDSPTRSLEYTIKGAFNEKTGCLPMRASEVEDLLNIDTIEGTKSAKYYTITILRGYRSLSDTFQFRE